MSTKTNEIFNQIDTLSMAELLEFVRLLEAVPEQNEMTIRAAHHAHGRIEFLGIVGRTRNLARSLASQRKSVKNAQNYA